MIPRPDLGEGCFTLVIKGEVIPAGLTAPKKKG
jgi:hypothetical protein